MRLSNAILLLIATTNAVPPGVTLYENLGQNGSSNGWSAFFAPGEHSGDFPTSTVTSYSISGDCCVSFFEHQDYLGENLTQCGPKDDDIPEDWYDTADSIKVGCFEKLEKGWVQTDGSGDFEVDARQKSILLKAHQQHLKDLLAGKIGEVHERKDYYDEQYQPVEIWQVVPGYIAFVVMWVAMLYPDVSDIVMFCYYSMNDFGSAIDLYVWNHENGWTYSAIIQFALSVGTVGFYVWVFVARFALGQLDVYTALPQMAAFMATNSVNLGLAVAKYAIIYYETELVYPDCGIFDCLFQMHHYVGQTNLQVEMYPDIYKVALLVLDYFVWMMFPSVDDWMSGRQLMWG